LYILSILLLAKGMLPAGVRKYATTEREDTPLDNILFRSVHYLAPTQLLPEFSYFG